MKIAIATDDQKTIRRGHFGDSRYYFIYEILNGEIYAEEVRENLSVMAKQHQHGQTKEIMDLLHDCQLFMGKSMGAKSLTKIAERNIEAIITTMDDIKEAVIAYLNSKNDYFKYYDAKTGTFCECSER